MKPSGRLKASGVWLGSARWHREERTRMTKRLSSPINWVHPESHQVSHKLGDRINELKHSHQYRWIPFTLTSHSTWEGFHYAHRIHGRTITPFGGWTWSSACDAIEATILLERVWGPWDLQVLKVRQEAHPFLTAFSWLLRRSPKGELKLRGTIV